MPGRPLIQRLPTLQALALLVGAGACVVEDPLDDGPFDPSVLYVSGHFAVVDGAVSAYRDGGEQRQPSIVLTVADERFFDQGDDEWLCTLQLATPGPVSLDAELMSEAQSPELLLAWTLPADRTLTGACPEDRLPRWEGWEDQLASDDWSVGLHALDDLVARTTRDDISASGGVYAEVEPFLAGSGFAWSALREVDGGSYLPNNRAQAWAYRGGSIDRDTPLRRDDALAEPLPDAVWEVQLVFGVDATLGLTSEPSR